MIRAVLFDFGGVVLASPLDGFRSFEAGAQLPAGFIQQLNLANPDGNAWARAERGELDEAGFFEAFAAEGRALGHPFDPRALFATLAGAVRPEMVAVIAALAPRYRVACLTNNMRVGKGSAMATSAVRAAEIAAVVARFHVVVESAQIGARKPEPRFFELALERVGVPAAECVFLDDLGQNLKPARAMGMQTIKVGDPAVAIAELARVLGHPVP